jgi:hypothetical protein
MHTATSTDGDHGPYHVLAGVPAPNPRPSNDLDFDWNQINLEEPPPPKRPKLASSKEFGQNDEYQVQQVQQPNLSSSPELSGSRLSEDLDLHWNHVKTEEPLLAPPKRPKLESSNKFSQTDVS